VGSEKLLGIFSIFMFQLDRNAGPQFSYNLFCKCMPTAGNFIFSLFTHVNQAPSSAVGPTGPGVAHLSSVPGRDDTDVGRVFDGNDSP